MTLKQRSHRFDNKRLVSLGTIVGDLVGGPSDHERSRHPHELPVRQGRERVDQAAIIILHIRHGRAVCLLPAHSEDAVAEWHELDVNGLGPGEWPFLDLEPQLRCRH